MHIADFTMARLDEQAIRAEGDAAAFRLVDALRTLVAYHRVGMRAVETGADDPGSHAAYRAGLIALRTLAEAWPDHYDYQAAIDHPRDDASARLARREDDASARLARREQEGLWDDLDDTLNQADGRWSIRAETTAYRLVQHIRVVGPTPYGRVPWSLVAGGVYAALLDAAEAAAEMPGDAEWVRLDRLMRSHGTPTRTEYQERMAPVVAAIRNDPDVQARLWEDW